VEPLTKVKYDSVLVINDRLTKYAYFLPYLESSDATDLAYTFLKTIFANHGMPEEIYRTETNGSLPNSGHP